MSWRRTFVVAAVVAAAPAGAQQQVSSPINDMLGQAKEAINNLKYDDAQIIVRQVLNLGGRLRRAQEVNALQVAAAAYFPEDTSAQRPDSALRLLRRMVRVAPDAQMQPDLAWRGLDSLLNVARADTFGAAATPDSAYVLIGADGPGYINAVASKPARFKLLIGPRDRIGAAVVDSSAGAVRQAKLAFRAHDGTDALIRTGEYEVRVLAIRADEVDTVSLRYFANASGVAPSLRTIPVAVDSSRLLRERRPPARAQGVATGIFLGGITWALANYARGAEPLRSAFAADSRATAIGAVFSAGAIAAGILDRGRPLPANVAANKAVIAEFRRSVTAAEAENRQRIAEYRVQFVIDTEAR